MRYKKREINMERGDIIRNKASGNTFVVLGSVDGQIVAARMLHVCNPIEWEKIERDYIGWKVPPTLIDRADGVKGHYTIGRSKDGSVYEYWDAGRELWCSAGTVFDYEHANNLLIEWNVPTAVL
jgi:hypothetical protein